MNLPSRFSIRRKIFTAGAAASALGAMPAGLVQAQTDALPGPLRILVGSAGAGPDILARLVADRLRAARGWNVIVENRLGAGGRIAIDATKDAPPDGLTMMVVSIELLTLYPLVFAKLNYDSFKDFVPVSGITSSPYALAVNAKSEYRTLAELVAWLKANPKASAFGTPGLGTPQQFLGTMLGRDAGMEFRHVPYKGGAPAMQDLMGGQIPCIITAYATAAGQARAGAIRILGHSGQTRLKSAPDVPTFAEAGFKSMVAEGDFIIAAQSRAPAEITRRVSDVVVADVKSDSFRAAVEKLGQEPLPTPPAEVAERMRRNHALWTGVVKATGFKAMEE